MMSCVGKRRRDGAPKLSPSLQRQFDTLLDLCYSGDSLPRIARLCRAVPPSAVKVTRGDGSPPVYFAKTPGWRQVDADPPWAQYSTPLRSAIQGGQLEVVKYLVETHGVDVSVGRPDSGSLPHNFAASLGELEIVRYLVRGGHGLSVRRGSSEAWKVKHNEPDEDSFVLRSACESGNAALVRFVLAEGCDVNAADPINGGTPLECACASGNLEIVRLVHTRGAKLDVSRHCDCCRGWTPVHEAAAASAPDVVDYLLRNGSHQVNQQCVGKDHITPLDLAFEADEMECAKVLFCHGAVLYCNRAQHDLRQKFISFAFKFRNGWSNLQLCAEFRRPDLAEWLLRAGRAHPAAIVRGLETPLAIAKRPSRFDGAAVCPETVSLMRRASRPWRIPTHFLHGPGFRRTVRTLMLVRESLERHSPVGVTLPLELWFKIISMMSRCDHDDIAPIRLVSFGDQPVDLHVLVANIGELLAVA